MSFGATVLVCGNSCFDVKASGTCGSPWMHAYQYFWRDGHVVG